MKKVLIVEDSKTTSDAMKILLEYYKYNVVQCFDSRTAVMQARKHKPGIILLDFMMPGMSGKEVLESLKADPELKDIPVILLTAKTDALKWNKELSKCDKFMTKPFDNKELMAEVKRLYKG
ncbi:response regulator [Candidatus Woesearchaeota archaeon]|nr:response regulator [Candidatus Woesearchaeota archaeon]